jgi:hypothetical protein
MVTHRRTKVQHQRATSVENYKLERAHRVQTKGRAAIAALAGRRRVCTNFRQKLIFMLDVTHNASYARS